MERLLFSKCDAHFGFQIPALQNSNTLCDPGSETVDWLVRVKGAVERNMSRKQIELCCDCVMGKPMVNLCNHDDLFYSKAVIFFHQICDLPVGVGEHFSMNCQGVALCERALFLCSNLLFKACLTYIKNICWFFKSMFAYQGTLKSSWFVAQWIPPILLLHTWTVLVHVWQTPNMT